MFKLKKKEQREITRITEYLVTGGAWFWSGYAMFAVCYSWIGHGNPDWLIPSKVISYIFGLTVNFLLQRYWVFSDSKTKQIDKVSGKYIALAVLNLGIDTLIVWSLKHYWNISPYIGQFVSAGFFTVWNYLWYKLWVFTKKASPGRKRQAAPVLRRSKHVRPVVKRRKRK